MKILLTFILLFVHCQVVIPVRAHCEEINVHCKIVEIHTGQCPRCVRYFPGPRMFFYKPSKSLSGRFP